MTLRHRCAELWMKLIMVCLGCIPFVNYRAGACGIDWQPPRYHFLGVDNAGHVSYWKKIDSIVVDDRLNIPLFIGFNSATKYTGIMMGAGWNIPLFESRVVQEDENTFLILLPDGNTLPMKRLSNGKSLAGAGGWMAEISENTISVWAQCGWKLVFVLGKISSITTPDALKLEYIYHENVLEEIRHGNSSIVKISSSPNKIMLNLGDRTVSIGLGQRPHVIHVSGANVVSSMDRAPATIDGASTKEMRYDHQVDDLTRPVLKVINDGILQDEFVWNPATSLIVKDKEWTYNVQNPKGSIIARVNKAGAEEYWSNDVMSGKTIERGVDGITIVSWVYTGGACNGFVRKREKIDNGVITTIYKADYDTDAHLIREIKENVIINYAHKSPWLVETITQNGKVVYSNFNLPVLESVMHDQR